MEKKKGKSNSQRKNAKKVIKKKHVNRNYKDSLFRMIFGTKEAALELYNAINQSNYQNPDILEITTIEGAIYMGVRNDLSFLVDSVMNLYEAQSTRNPNMPLRGLIYFAKVYQGYVEKRGFDIYSGSQVKIPVPQYIVLYNGTAKEPDRREYRLSEAFEKQQESCCLECVATVLNINAGHNKQLMESSSRLWQYASFVVRVRQYVEVYPDNLERAIDAAVEECITEGILADFLLEHRGGVKDVMWTEYHAELHIKNEKRLSYEEGVESGIEQGIQAFIISGTEEGADKTTILEKLQKFFRLDGEKAEQYYEKFAGNSSDPASES